MTMENETEAKEAVASSALFAIGDKVKFVRSRPIGRSIEVKVMEGKIIEFSRPHGSKALIKYHGGNYIWRKVANLRRPDQPSPLMDNVANSD